MDQSGVMSRIYFESCREVVTTLTEAKILIEEWRKEYNQVRSHSALNYRPSLREAIIPLTLT